MQFVSNNASEAEVVEKIDIGVALLRAAARTTRACARLPVNLIISGF